MGDGQQERRAEGGDVVGGVAVGCEVFQVVVDLVGDAEGLAVLADDLPHVLVRPRVEGTEPQSHLEGGRRLLAEDV